MLLAIDIGNSNIVFGVHSGDKWIKSWRIRTDRERMPDEYGVFFRELLREEGINKSDISKSVMSSVVPPLTGKISQMVKTITGKVPIILGPGVKTGLKIRTDNPAEVGTDLVANTVAAHNRFKKNCIVVDFGTALTFSAVNEKGEFLGVSIAPGLYSAGEALTQHTAQLPSVWLKKPPRAIGKNTTHSMQSGMLFGYIGLVEKIINTMKEELDGETIVIATGGGAELIAPYTECFTLIEPWLILEGLRVVAGLN